MTHHKLRLLLALAASGLAAAACSDDASVEPTATAVAPSFRIARQCDAPGIRSALGQMLQGPAVTATVPRFNQAETARRAGNSAAALEDYGAVIERLVAEYAEGRVGVPQHYADAQDATDYVISSILACAGSPLSGGGTIVGGVGEGPGDRTVCVALPGASNECTLPNADVTILTSPTFLDGLALFVIARTPTVNPFVGYERWSPIWQVQVLPLTAQTNYPYYAGPGAPWPAPPADPDAFAVIGVCVVDVAGEHHPPVGELQVAQAVELPTTGPVVELEPVTGIGDEEIDERLDCTAGPGTSPVETPTSLATPFGSSRFALASWRVVRGAGSAFAGLLAPTPLHAARRFDGGIGGKTFAMQSRFAVVEPEDDEVPAPSLSIFEGAPNPSEGPITATAVAIGFTTELLARVPSAAASVPATYCSWQSNNASVASVTPAPGSAAAVVDGLSTGTATVTANCAEGLASVTIQVSPPVTVAAPPGGAP